MAQQETAVSGNSASSPFTNVPFCYSATSPGMKEGEFRMKSLLQAHPSYPDAHADKNGYPSLMCSNLAGKASTYFKQQKSKMKEAMHLHEGGLSAHTCSLSLRMN